VDERDLLADAVVRLLDQGNSRHSPGHRRGTGLELATVDRALEALEGPYVVEYEQFATGGDPSSWRVRKVTATARQAVGQWPTAESLIARLTEALSEAAEHEPDPGQKSRLQAIASGLGGSARQIAIDVAARIVEHQTGLG
jgi:hypothetical protein